MARKFEGPNGYQDPNQDSVDNQTDGLDKSGIIPSPEIEQGAVSESQKDKVNTDGGFENKAFSGLSFEGDKLSDQGKKDFVDGKKEKKTTGVEGDISGSSEFKSLPKALRKRRERNKDYDENQRPDVEVVPDLPQGKDSGIAEETAKIKDVNNNNSPGNTFDPAKYMAGVDSAFNTNKSKKPEDENKYREAIDKGYVAGADAKKGPKKYNVTKIDLEERRRKRQLREESVIEDNSKPEITPDIKDEDPKIESAQQEPPNIESKTESEIKPELPVTQTDESGEKTKSETAEERSKRLAAIRAEKLAKSKARRSVRRAEVIANRPKKEFKDSGEISTSISINRETSTGSSSDTIILEAGPERTTDIKDNPIAPEANNKPDTPESNIVIDKAEKAVVEDNKREVGANNNKELPPYDDRSSLKKAWDWLGDRTYKKWFNSAKEYGQFQMNRATSYGNLVVANFFGGRELVKREGFIAAHSIADTEVKQIVEALNSLDNIKDTSGPLSPNQAKQIEKDSIKLRNKLVKAQQRRDEAMRGVKFHEGKALIHENKKKHIAENFAHIVGERIKPHADRFEVLLEKKLEEQEEIKVWKEQIDADNKELNSIKESMRDNPFLNNPSNKQKIKDIEERIKYAYKEQADKANDLLRIDKNLVDTRDILKFWDNKKQAYNRYAKEAFEIFEPEKKRRAPMPKDFRDPVPVIGSVGNSSPNSGGGFEGSVQNESIIEDEGGAEAMAESRREMREVTPKYSFKEWADAWNSLNGSRFKITEAAAIDAGADVSGPLAKNAFSTIVINLHRVNKDGSAKGKITPLDFVQTENLVIRRKRAQSVARNTQNNSEGAGGGEAKAA